MIIDLDAKRREKLLAKPLKELSVMIAPETSAPDYGFSRLECYLLGRLKQAYLAEHGGTIPITDWDIIELVMESTLDCEGIPKNADSTFRVSGPIEDLEPTWLAALESMIESHNEMAEESQS